MNDERLEQGPVLDLPWLLAGSFVVLLAGYAFVVFVLGFLAGSDDVRFLGDVAAFILIFTVAVFALLLFVSANETEPEEPEEELIPEEEWVTEVEAGATAAEAVQAGSCAACGRVNPDGANFCYHCGRPLSKRGSR